MEWVLAQVVQNAVTALRMAAAEFEFAKSDDVVKVSIYL